MKHFVRVIFVIVFTSFSVFSSAQCKQTTYRPKVIVLNEDVFPMLDSTIAILDQHPTYHQDQYAFKIFEAKCENIRHCWLEGGITVEEIRMLKDDWDGENKWPEGYFEYKNALVFVQTDIPGVNFKFTSQFELIDISTYCLLSNSLYGRPMLIISSAVKNDDGRIDKPFYVEWK